MRLLPLAALLTLIALPAHAGEYWHALAEEIGTELEGAVAAHAQGDGENARRAVVNAYFGLFESRKMEAAMRTQLGAKHTYQVEKGFGQLRKAVRGSDNGEQVAALARELRTALLRDAEQLDAANIPADVFEVNK